MSLVIILHEGVSSVCMGILDFSCQVLRFGLGFQGLGFRASDP